MILPQWLQDKVNELYLSLNKKILTETRENLTKRYKEQTGQGKSLIENKKDSMLYAISRMPATFSVIYTLMRDLTSQNLLKDITTVLDVGSGTGAGYFALKDFDESLDINLIERDKNMIDVFKTLTGGLVDVSVGDIRGFNTEKKFDLVVSSYVLSELGETDRKVALKNLMSSSNRYVLVVDTGTPKTYEFMMELKRFVTENGWHVIAPCMHKECALKNDYCQFFARVERSSLHRLAKDATLSYEDEKYFYLLISKDNKEITGKRIIRRPFIKEGGVSLVLCGETGVENKTFTKKNKEEFKKTKKSKINQII